MWSRSPTSVSLLVAWEVNASARSSALMPMPSSRMTMRSDPPAATSTSMRVAPASREFSTSSFTTDAGRSTTSPAAIRSTTFCGSLRMRANCVIGPNRLRWQDG